jgi:hypothetical protein
MKLKEIITESGIGGFGSSEPQKKMSVEEKKQLLAMVNQYNECGKQLYNGDIRQIAENLLKVSELAEKYALEEANEDMLQTKTIHEDMKTIRKDAAEIAKIAKEAWAANERMKACYENIGSKLSRYYEIN